MSQKWINEDGIFFPVTGTTILKATPGYGVFNVVKDRDNRLGLKRIEDEFTFDFKIYELGCDDIFRLVEETWNNPEYKSSGRNLGVIFNGLKGTGKTIAAKLLCNKLKLPVVIVPEPFEGLANFIQDLEFECVVLVDEAEKTFEEEDEVLLRMIESVYKKTRKVFILTTNELDINKNLLGRPGRIRYIKHFGNLTSKAVLDYLDDNLKYDSQRETILRIVDTLEISTIDILKSIVDEINIHGTIANDSMLNIPKAKIQFECLVLQIHKGQFDETKNLILNQLGTLSSATQWVKMPYKNGTNEKYLEEKGIFTRHEFIEAESKMLYDGMRWRNGVILQAPDKYGFFIYKRNYHEEEDLAILLQTYDCQSLYKGLLI